jgi:hypothetical protein
MLLLGCTYICNLRPHWKVVVNGKYPFGLTIAIKSLIIPTPALSLVLLPCPKPYPGGGSSYPTDDLLHPPRDRIQW